GRNAGLTSLSEDQPELLESYQRRISLLLVVLDKEIIRSVAVEVSVCENAARASGDSNIRGSLLRVHARGELPRRRRLADWRCSVQQQTAAHYERRRQQRL